MEIVGRRGITLPADRAGSFGLFSALARVGGALLAVAAAWYWIRIWTHAMPGFPGRDVAYYVEGARRWLETGTPYLASEIASEFVYSEPTFLHPPISLPLFAPFIVLPLALWWVLPIGFLIAFVAWCRPAAWAWPLIGFALLWHHTGVAVVAGNSDLWVAAFVAAGLRLGWPFVLVAVKPSLGFLALGGVGRRSWWMAAGAMAATSLLFGTLWIDWFRVVANSPGSIAYSLTSLPLVLLPIVAWAARQQERPPSLLSTAPAR